MISVVIATRDRAALLERTLAALGAQELEDGAIEVLIVDNGSFQPIPTPAATTEVLIVDNG